MRNKNDFDVIIVGGSYSGLAAAMALGRALKKVLVINSGLPCNWQTPYSHNFLTHDGDSPTHIAALANLQVRKYDTLRFYNGLATGGTQIENGFEIGVATGERFKAKHLVFATGIKDIMPDIPGYSACWGISVLHCPYCHGYEIRNVKTGILGNGDHGFELASLISNWTNDLTLFTNGPSTLTTEQCEKLQKHTIKIVENKVERLDHDNGFMQTIIFKDGTTVSIAALYARSAFEQHCTLPEFLGCELTIEGYLAVDPSGETTVKGIYACGDNATRIRTVANVVAMGTTAGMVVSKKMIFEEF